MVSNVNSDRRVDLELEKYVSNVAFWAPSCLHDPTSWVEHIPFAFWLVNALRPNVVVELGTHTGNSYLALCQAVRQLGLSAQCFAIDTWLGDEHAGFYGEEVFNDLSEFNRAHYAAFSTLVRSTFDQASEHFTDRSIDLLHIDGRHFYDDVKHDFETWFGKLSDRAVVLLHDTNVRERQFGVFRLWEELRGRYPSFEFHHGHGLGVLGVGSELPQPVRNFFEDGSHPEIAPRICEVYARLGAALTDRKVNLRLRAKTKEQDMQLADLRSRQEEIGSLQKESSNTRERLGQLEANASGHRQELASALARISELEVAVRKLGSELEASEVRKAELEASSVELQSIVEYLRAEFRYGLGNTSPARPRGVRKLRLLTRASDMLLWITQFGEKGQVPREVRRQAELLAKSPLFDRDWYLRQYPDVAKAGIDPTIHYLTFGAIEGRDPGPLFDSDWYLSRYPDVGSARLNPLVHYLLHGEREGRARHPLAC